MHIAKVPGAKSGDLVVVTAEGQYQGCVAQLEIRPGFDTICAIMGALHVRMNVGDVRALRTTDRVVNP